MLYKIPWHGINFYENKEQLAKIASQDFLLKLSLHILNIYLTQQTPNITNYNYVSRISFAVHCQKEER